MALGDVLDYPLVYLVWQGPFIRSKLRPFLKHNELSQIGRVLEIGCGPGTNAHLFQHVDYLGIDINPRYIEAARRRFGDRFEQADATRFVPRVDESVQAVFMNSFMHHISDDDSRTLLKQMASILPAEGRIHILDLVLPERASIARWLAVHDRGDFARPLARWKELFCESFEPEIFEPYALSLCGVALWQMVYFRGRPRHA
jgi:SAM-dependent methyltransferase